MASINTEQQIRKYLDLYFALKKEMEEASWDPFAKKYEDIAKELQYYVATIEKEAENRGIKIEDLIENNGYKIGKDQFEKVKEILGLVAETKSIKNIAKMERDIFGSDATSYITFVQALKGKAVIDDLAEQLDDVAKQLDEALKSKNNSVDVDVLKNELNAIIENNFKQFVYPGKRKSNILLALSRTIGKSQNKGETIFDVLDAIKGEAENVTKRIDALSNSGNLIGDLSNENAKLEALIAQLGGLSVTGDLKTLVEKIKRFETKFDKRVEDAVSAISAELFAIQGGISAINNNVNANNNNILKTNKNVVRGSIAIGLVVVVLGGAGILLHIHDKKQLKKALAELNNKIKDESGDLKENGNEFDYASYFSKVNSITEALTAALADDSISDEEKAEIQNKIAELTAIENETAKDFASKFGKDINSVMDSYIGIQAQITNLSSQITTLNDSIGTLNASVSTLEGTVANLNNKIAELEEKINNLPGDVDNLRSQLDQAKADLDAANQRIEELSAANVALTNEKEALIGENIDLRSQIEIVRIQAQVVEDELETVTAERDDFAEKYAKAVADYEELLVAYNGKIDEYNNLVAQYEALAASSVSKEELDEAEANLVAATIELDKARDVINGLNQTLDETNARLAAEIEANKNNQEFVSNLYSSLFGTSSEKSNGEMLAEIADALGLDISVDISGLEADESGRSKQ